MSNDLISRKEVLNVKHDLKILPEYFGDVISGKRSLNFGRMIGIIKSGICSFCGSGS